MLCFECNQKESDNEPRVYRERATSRIFHGTRNFCSDECEDSYCDKMSAQSGTDPFERIDNKS